MANTKNQKVSVAWIVSSGPDDSHLIDVEFFDRRRDAIARFDDIKDRRPCTVTRSEWRSEYVAEDCEQRVVALSSLRRAVAQEAA
jgi:hypothetical protein